MTRRYRLWRVAVEGHDVGILANPEGLTRAQAKHRAQQEHPRARVSVTVHQSRSQANAA